MSWPPDGQSINHPADFFFQQTIWGHDPGFHVTNRLLFSPLEIFMDQAQEAIMPPLENSADVC